MPTPIGYDAVLVVVLIELIFAFGIGISCIIFSFNMYREVSLNGDKMDALPVGELPSRQTFRNSNMSGNSNNTTTTNNNYNNNTPGRATSPNPVLRTNSISNIRDSEIMSNRTSDDNSYEELEDGIPVPARDTNGKFTYVDTLQHFLDYMRIW